ncbi:phospholipid/cholesterol/gamma-HCH transport system substrate-binding protein [Amycolatopsis marina]|uniref:Phospholipid/cholesterol/gamma-HCH transport system substrate-binding protein n=1 Tax=Amycolatopsis marina TaxID=490629 RepID=A0A1I0YIW1_9PSEU|nr:MlaD family protein [Amycolatopsis marina]SFB13385.1 phospholipid/cholesterol/gamma-HCH transport system substrate-binding protein [Amycolatopsis marina]
MISRLVRGQLLLFVTLTVVCLVVAGVHYIGLPRLLGVGQMPVYVELPASGGLYPAANVTYRGVKVGRVDRIELTGKGVIADLSVDRDVDIPADVSAAVRQTSAVGEQYVALMPNTTGPPHLAEGATIPVERTSLPTPVETVLDNAKSLVDSVPQDSLRTTLDEAYLAYNGSGKSVQRLLDSAGRLTEQAQQHLDSTGQLLADAPTVLGTQRDSAAEIQSYAADLAAFTGELKSTDEALRGVLDQAPAYAEELTTLVEQVRPALPRLLNNMAATGEVFNVYLPNLEASLVMLPAIMNNTLSVAATTPVPGTAKMNLKTSINDPATCTEGFGNEARDPSDTNPLPTADDAYCKVPQDSDLLVRGARNSPCPNDATRRSATAAGCGLQFIGGAGAGTTGPRKSDGPERTGAATYDPLTGLFFGPGGKSFLLREDSGVAAHPGVRSLLDPLGLAPA